MFNNLLSHSRNRALSSRARRGMTLMEIMVVIAIIGTIMTVVAVNVLEIFGESNVENTKIQMAKHGQCPHHSPGNPQEQVPFQSGRREEQVPQRGGADGCLGYGIPVCVLG